MGIKKICELLREFPEIRTFFFLLNIVLGFVVTVVSFGFFAGRHWTNLISELDTIESQIMEMEGEVIEMEQSLKNRTKACYSQKEAKVQVKAFEGGISNLKERLRRLENSCFR